MNRKQGCGSEKIDRVGFGLAGMPENRIRTRQRQDGPRHGFRSQQPPGYERHQDQRQTASQKWNQAQGIGAVAQRQENRAFDPEKERRGAFGKQQRTEKLGKILADRVQNEGRFIMLHGRIAAIMKDAQSKA